MGERNNVRGDDLKARILRALREDRVDVEEVVRGENRLSGLNVLKLVREPELPRAVILIDQVGSYRHEQRDAGSLDGGGPLSEQQEGRGGEVDDYLPQPEQVTGPRAPVPGSGEGDSDNGRTRGHRQRQLRKSSQAPDGFFVRSTQLGNRQRRHGHEARPPT